MKKYSNNTLNELIERFFRYVSIPSQSDDSSNQLPSSPGQMELANLLKTELEDMGLEKIELTKDAILTAYIKGNKPGPSIGFIAHLDTFDAGYSPVIHPQILHKEPSRDLLLNKEKDIWLRESQIEEIKKYQDQDIIVTDGTSVLGADNKAAISVLMTLANKLSSEESSHGDIYLAFVPDEEIGLKGAKALDLKRFPVDYAYTIDSNELGEIIYETFNAGSAQIEIDGVTAHPMSAKNVLENPLLIANEIINSLNPGQRPEHTENKEGYIWPTNLQANPAHASLTLNIRDHDLEKYKEKKDLIEAIIDLQRQKHPVKIQLDIEDVYSNIGNSIPSKDHPVVKNLSQAMEELGIDTKYIAMRGGTDGSALSAKGIPTPNFFTGAHQFHSIYEFLPVESFLKSYQVAERLVEIWGR